MAVKNEKPAANPANDKPRFTAYIVVDAPQDDSNRKAQWHRIAPAFAHDDGKGFNIELPPGVSVAGRLVVRQDEPREANRNA